MNRFARGTLGLIIGLVGGAPASFALVWAAWFLRYSSFLYFGGASAAPIGSVAACVIGYGLAALPMLVLGTFGAYVFACEQIADIVAVVPHRDPGSARLQDPPRREKSVLRRAS